MIVDVHVHLPYHKIFPPAFIRNISDNLTNGDTTKNALIQKIIRANLNDAGGEGLVKQMDEAKIDKAVLLIADFGIAMGEAELSIGEMHELHYSVLQKFPERFIVFGGVDPKRGREGYDVFEASIRKYGFKGLKLYPPCGFELDDKELYPLYDICNQYKLPVLSHTGPSFSSLRTERRFPETALNVSNDFPHVNFILGHGGAVAWQSNLEIAAKRENVYLEISTFQNTVTTHVELEERFRNFFDQAPDKIMFGSDWPMFMMGSTLKGIVQIIQELKSITEAEKEKLLYKNASQFFNI